MHTALDQVVNIRLLVTIILYYDLVLAKSITKHHRQGTPIVVICMSHITQSCNRRNVVCETLHSYVTFLNRLRV